MGSNIEPESHLVAAVELLAQRVPVRAVSSVFETMPAGGSSGPIFLNAAVEIRYDEDPRSLKYEILRPLEGELERIRSADRNAPRTIDLDISLFGSRVVEQPGLQIPDPEIVSRAHVAVPLADLAPEFVHPVEGLTLAEIASGLRGHGVRVRPELDLWPRSDRL